MAGSLHQVECGVGECSELQCTLIYGVYGSNIPGVCSVQECQPCITIAVPCSIWVIYSKTRPVIKLLSLFSFFSLGNLTRVLC